MEDVKDWLDTNGLGEYWPNFEEHGWEEMSLLSEMSDVDFEMCITKRGHRAKFRKALRSLTDAAATSNTCDSASSSEVERHQNINVSGEVGAEPRGETRHATPSFTQVYETTTQLGGRESTVATLEKNRTETTVTVKRLDETETDLVNAVGEVDKTHLAEIGRVPMAISGMSNDNRIEIVQEPNATPSITNVNQVPGFEEERLESCDSNDIAVSLSTEFAAVGQSCTVIDDTILDGPEPLTMNRGPPNITIIKSSENTTVNQGQTHLHVAPEADQTNNPVCILKGQMQILADSYREKDQLYVETKAFHEFKSVVEEMHWATLLGNPGDGKSATAAHLLLQYTQRGYEPVFLSSPRDWKMLISVSPDMKQVVVIDDIFGQSYLDDNNNVGKWNALIESMSRIVKERNGNLVVICTSRRYIFKDIETVLTKFACFSKHAIVDMSGEQYKLSGDEKLTIFKTFSEVYTIEEDVAFYRNIYCVDPPHGFPHCVELYCTNAFLRKQGIAFFRNPVQYVHREICNFRDNDRVKFLVLLLVLNRGEKLGLDELDKIMENTTDDDKKFFQTAGVSLETAIPDIHRTLTGLINTYLKQNSDGSFSFSHHSLKETLADFYITVNPSHAIQVLEFQHIITFTSRKRDDEKSHFSNVCLPFGPLAKRMISEIENGYVSFICDCDVWSDRSFVQIFLSLIEKEPLTFLESMFYSNDLLVWLIEKRQYDAAIAIIENEFIGKALQNSDRFVESLQSGLEATLHDAYIRDVNVDLIKALVTARFVDNSIKLDGSKLLFEMLYDSKVELTILLIDKTRIDPQNTDGFFDTYFHRLVRSTIDLQHFEVLCQKLQQAGVDINQTDWSDVPAVFYCLNQFEDKGWDRLLCMVRYGANILKHYKSGNIVLFTVNISLLSSKLCVEILTKLSDFDADFHSTDKTGSNALHIACQKKPDEGIETLLEYLLSKGLKAESVNNYGVVPFMIALQNNISLDVVKLLAKNSPLNHIDNNGQGYFHYLMRSHSITDTDVFCDKCEILLKLGSCINEKDNKGKPPIVHLMEQCKYTQTECDLVKLFQFLIERGLDLHAKDVRGQNVVLHVLNCKITEETLPLLCYLHSVDLDFELTDIGGRNALHHLFANVQYSVYKVICGDSVFDYYMYQDTDRELPEALGNILKKIYEFLTNGIGLLPTVGDKHGINAVMLALENYAGCLWIKDLLKLDIPLQTDDWGRNYFHYLAESRAPDDNFEILKTALLNKGLTIDMQVLMDRPKQQHKG